MRTYEKEAGLAGFLLIMSLGALAETETYLSSMAYSKFGRNPADQSDIVGRDLNVPLAGVLGHVGLWTGNMVIEALNQTPAIVQNTLLNFKSRSRYWGAIYFQNWNTLPLKTLPTDSRVPFNYRNFYAKGAAVQRAYLVQQIGADYSLSPFPEAAFVQECKNNLCVGPTRGKYRCDTFVKDAYLSAGAGGLRFRATESPATLWKTYTERR